MRDNIHRREFKHLPKSLYPIRHRPWEVHRRSVHTSHLSPGRQDGEPVSSDTSSTAKQR